MPAYFFDTSGIVKRYIEETGTGWVQAKTDSLAANKVYLAGISTVEVASAVTRRQRAGDISLARAASILAQFRQDLTQEYLNIEITPAILAAAARLAESHGLRANDAIQLAAAVELLARRNANGLGPVTLVSSDDALNEAAATFGIMVENPNLHP